MTVFAFQESANPITDVDILKPSGDFTGERRYPDVLTKGLIISQFCELRQEWSG